MNESNYGRIFHVFKIEGFLVNLFYKKMCAHLLKDVRKNYQIQRKIVEFYFAHFVGREGWAFTLVWWWDFIDYEETIR